MPGSGAPHCCVVKGEGERETETKTKTREREKTKMKKSSNQQEVSSKRGRHLLAVGLFRQPRIRYQSRRYHSR
jgi:hypothetical protein